MIAPRWTGRSLCVLASLRLCAAPLAAQIADSLPVVSLAQARRLAAAVDPVLVASRADVATAGWERRSARADLLTPNLFAGVSYIRFSEPFFNFGTGDISPNATSATLEARYVALGAGKLSELRRAGASAASALANETASSFRSALVTDAAYYAVLAELELSRVAAARLSRALEQLGVARVRVQAGETIATDSLQLVLEVNRARLDVLRRDSALIVSRLRLGRQIGLPGPADARAVDSLPPPPLPMTFDEAVADLRTRGPELLAARAEERRASASLGAQREGYLPDVTLSATTGAYDSEFFPSATKRSQFAVTVSVPIWDGRGASYPSPVRGRSAMLPAPSGTISTARRRWEWRRSSTGIEPRGPASSWPWWGSRCRPRRTGSRARGTARERPPSSTCSRPRWRSASPRRSWCRPAMPRASPCRTSRRDWAAGCSRIPTDTGR